MTVADIELGDEKKIGFSLELLSICIARNEMVSYVGYGFEVLTVLDVITVLQLSYNILLTISYWVNCVAQHFRDPYHSLFFRFCTNY